MCKLLFSLWTALACAACVDLAPDDDAGASSSPVGPDTCTWATDAQGGWFVDCGQGDDLLGRCEDDPDACTDGPWPG